MIVSLAQPQVSVIIPAYNCAAYLPAALNSVLSQSYQPKEVIVVDDGSTDQTADIARSHSGVICISQPNGGLSNARNTGISAAKGEYIALLDADDIWTPEILAEQMKMIASHPDVGFLFGDAQRFSDNGWIEEPLFQKYGLGADHFGHDYLVLDPVPKLLRMNFISVGAVIVRKQWLVEAGLFDETLRRVEDWDMWLRVALTHPIAYSLKVWMLRRVHQTNLSRNTEAMAQTAIRVFEKLQQQHFPELMVHGANVNRYLRDAYRSLGYFYLRQIALEEARQALSHSLALGFQPRTLVYFLLTFLGRGLVGSLVRARG